MRLLVALALACGVVSCSPLYGSRPEKLKNPEKKKRPPEVDQAQVEVKYVEECSAIFNGDPKTVKPQTSMANTLVTQGETAVDQADKAKEDSMKVSLIKEAIEKYRNALIKDPWNVAATLKLAIAYDRMLRKGCAIAMLKRLASLSGHPKWREEANRNIDTIDANGQWFKGYRKEAMAAVGR
jgi:hypothetical protein